MINKLFDSINLYFKFIPIYVVNFYYDFIKINFHFHLLMSFLGGLHFVIKRKIYYIFLPLIAMYLLNIINSGINGNYHSIRYGVEGLLMIGFIHYLAYYFDKTAFYKLLVIILSCSLIYFIFEYFIRPSDIKTFLFNTYFPFNRVNGITGYSNHTGILMATIGTIFLAEKKYWGWLASLLLCIPTSSRTALLVFLLGSLLFIEQFCSKKIWKGLCYSTLTAILTSPIIVYLIELSINDTQKLFINKLTTFKYALHLVHLEIFFDNLLLGVGIHNSHNLYQAYKSTGSTIITSKQYNIPEGEWLPHGMWIQSLVENGIIGYLLFISFISYFVFKTMKINPRHAWGIICMFVGYLTINGLNDFAFHYYFAFILSVYLSKDLKFISQRPQTFEA